jgi:hypothetical protein
MPARAAELSVKRTFGRYEKTPRRISREIRVVSTTDQKTGAWSDAISAFDQFTHCAQIEYGGSRKGSKGNAVRGWKTPKKPRLPPQL